MSNRTSLARTVDVARSSASLVASMWGVVAVSALGILSFLTRKGSLPFDGLWFDDSWVAAGAILGRPAEILDVGSSHPSFTMLLMGVHRLGDGSLRQLGVPSLVAGVLAPPIVYLVLRSLSYSRSVCFLMASALVVARTHILYSGRVKPYTFDLLGVLLLAALLPWIARRTWRWPLALGWGLFALAMSTVSGFLFVATAGAGLVLVMHPASDRALRLVAVGLQAAAQLVYFLVLRSRADMAGIESSMETLWDGHMTFSLNPADLVREASTHLGHVAQVYPGGPHGLWLPLSLLALGGLVAGAMARTRKRPLVPSAMAAGNEGDTGGRSLSYEAGGADSTGRTMDVIVPAESIAARFLLLLVAVAFVGAFAGRFPFGPTTLQTGPATADYPRLSLLTVGGRHSLWLVPAIIVGLAAVLERSRRQVGRRYASKRAFDLAAVALAIFVLFAGFAPAPSAPYQGTESATEFIDGSIRPGDAVILASTSAYGFAISSELPSTLTLTPDKMIGYSPRPLDPRVHVLRSEKLAEWAEGARTVYVLSVGPVGLGFQPPVAETLAPLGFTQTIHTFDDATVEVWQR
ncbi:MAG: hypothetical protein ABWZ52_00175 [Acidimicrobiales bacterium]